MKVIYHCSMSKADNNLYLWKYLTNENGKLIYYENNHTLKEIVFLI